MKRVFHRRNKANPESHTHTHTPKTRIPNCNPLIFDLHPPSINAIVLFNAHCCCCCCCCHCCWWWCCCCWCSVWCATFDRKFSWLILLTKCLTTLIRSTFYSITMLFFVWAKNAYNLSQRANKKRSEEMQTGIMTTHTHTLSERL